MKPTISVVTICRNSSETIEETIGSVLSQDYEGLDYVIIDGGSTDGTLNIIERYRQCLGYFVSEPDGGISDAFNKGVKAAKGDLIVMINSDDVLLPGALRRVAEEYEEGKWDVYRCNMIIRNKATNFVGRSVPAMRFQLIPWQLNVNHQSTIDPREEHQRWGLYDTNFRYMMDHDFLARCYRGGARFKRVDADVAEFRIGGVSLDSIEQKRSDIEHVVLNQGGKPWQAWVAYRYFWLFDLARRAVINCFGLNALKRLHYPKVALAAKERPKVSVCMATYNGMRYIEGQMQSVLRQLEEGDEVIVSDDGSTDGTLQYIESLGDKRIKILRHERYTTNHRHYAVNRTVSANFENALRHATGQYIFLCDQDDIWREDKVRRMVAELQKHERWMAISDHSLIDPEGNVICEHVHLRRFTFAEGLVRCNYLGSSMAFDRALLEQALPFPKDNLSHDGWISLLAMWQGRLSVIGEPLNAYRRHAENVTADTVKHAFWPKIAYRWRFLLLIISKSLTFAS